MKAGAPCVLGIAHLLNSTYLNCWDILREDRAEGCFPFTLSSISHHSMCTFCHYMWSKPQSPPFPFRPMTLTAAVLTCFHLSTGIPFLLKCLTLGKPMITTMQKLRQSDCNHPFAFLIHVKTLNGKCELPCCTAYSDVFFPIPAFQGERTRMRQGRWVIKCNPYERTHSQEYILMPFPPFRNYYHLTRALPKGCM